MTKTPQAKPTRKKNEAPVPNALARTIRASYDSAGYDPDLVNHWRYANGASANAAGDHEQRRAMVNRSRYELLENNSLARGIIETLVHDAIGTGPKLQLRTGNQEVDRQVTGAWNSWIAASGFVGKLRTLRRARTVDGEAFAILSTNPGLRHPVQLDVNVVECDRVTSPNLRAETQTYIDGVQLDPFGNVVSYDVLDYHPGDTLWGGNPTDYTTFNADNVIHWFRQDRPEQRRGVPECQSALPLFAIKRRFTLATVLAAENAANHAMVLAMGEGAFDHMAPDPDAQPWMTLELKRNMATVVPHGHLEQIKPEHPATTYEMFTHSLVNEMARCINMPFNIAMANSAGYNYASGRLDHQVYDRAIKIDQRWCEQTVVNRVFQEWAWEAALAGLLPADATEAVMAWRESMVEVFPMQLVWTWDRRPHVDPTKEAQAQLIRLKNGTTSRRHEALEGGMDLEEIDEAAAESYDMDVREYRKRLADALFGAASGSMPVSEVPDDQDDAPEETTEDAEESTDEEA